MYTQADHYMFVLGPYKRPETCLEHPKYKTEKKKNMDSLWVIVLTWLPNAPCARDVFIKISFLLICHNYCLGRRTGEKYSSQFYVFISACTVCQIGCRYWGKMVRAITSSVRCTRRMPVQCSAIYLVVSFWRSRSYFDDLIMRYGWWGKTSFGAIWK